MFNKKGALKHFAKFTGKLLSEFLFNKVAGFSHATLFKKVLAHLFSFELCDFLKHTLFTKHLQTTASEAYLTGAANHNVS